MDKKLIIEKWNELSFSMQQGSRPQMDCVVDMLQLLQNMVFEIWSVVTAEKPPSKNKEAAM